MGFLVDVSASVHKKNSSLDAFTHTLNHTITQIKQVDQTALSENNIDCFAYGFGFDNPFSLLSGKKTPSIKNLFGRNIKKPIVSLKEVDNNWESYSHDIKNLAIKANGTSTMMEGLKQVEKTFNTLSTQAYGLKILIILSDGLVSDAPSYEIIKQIEQLKKQNTVVVTLYFSDKSTVKSKIIHNQVDPKWDEGAQLMFECASSISPHTYLSSYLQEYDWTIYSDGKLFTQIHSQQRRQITKQRKQLSPKAKRDIIFISHHHKNKSRAKEIEQYLSSFKKDAAITIWDEHQIDADKNWQDKLDTQLLSTRAVILLISPEYLTSQFIIGEALAPLLQRANHNGTKIIPLILEPSRFQFITWLSSSYQPINSAYQPLSAMPKSEQDDVIKKLVESTIAALS